VNVAAAPPVVVVPGFTPSFQRTPIRLHPLARSRVREGWRTARRLGIRTLLMTGGAVYPEGTPYVEAEEMAAFLRALGCPAERILVEPNARHTTTNLRNAGRVLRAQGWDHGLVVTTKYQWLYLAFPAASGFHRRCERELGYRVGALSPAGPGRVRFAPSADVEREGPDPLDR